MTATDGWLRVPVDPTAGDWLTVRTERTVLAVVHTLAGAVHIQDAVEQIESDPRIQMVFTQAPDLFSHRVAAFLDRLDGVTIPWQQAVHARFDLAVVADTAEVHELRAPILLVPHGVMNNKLAPPALAGVSGDLVVGLAAPWLTRFGNLVPAAVALSHDYLIDVLALQCRPALEVARVVGDLCLDRLVASRANAERYREQFGVAQGQVLVAISSTWGPFSLFGQWKSEVYEAAAALSPEYRVVAVMHPALWFGHGPRQIARWLARAHRNGLRLVDPLTWRALIAAADVLVGDHGSVSLYAAAIGVPVLQADDAPESVKVESAYAVLAGIAPKLSSVRPLADQLHDAMSSFNTPSQLAVEERISSRPGCGAQLLRSLMYELLVLDEPPDEAHAGPISPSSSRSGVDSCETGLWWRE